MYFTDEAWAERQKSGNPIWPYQWVAHYYGGGRLQQFDIDSYHKSTDIELHRLERIVVSGPHALAPFVLPVPAGSPPDRVLMKAQIDYEMDLSGTITRRAAEHFFGFVYTVEGQPHEFLLHIDRQGRVAQTKKGF